MSKIFDILQGHLNELVGNHEDLVDIRLNICKECPLYKLSQYGPLCDSDKWINKDGEVSNHFIVGYTRGCGCRLSAKTRVLDAKCIIGRW